VEVPAPFSGTIVELLVEDGNKVTAKQKIYKLEKGDSPGGTSQSSAPSKKEEKPTPEKKEESVQQQKPRESGKQCLTLKLG
jgi:pyruvate/2-oxoglutarate dehydrogenase complex dihydrolipoamide acyltransferase (E2) component